MELVSTQRVQSHTIRGQAVSLRQTYEESGIQDTCCSKWIEPINAIAIGEYFNRNSDGRNALALIFDPELRRKCKLICTFWEFDPHAIKCGHW